jgi:thiol-disulfide isomerase/thioredoxin
MIARPRQVVSQTDHYPAVVADSNDQPPTGAPASRPEQAERRRMPVAWKIATTVMAVTVFAGAVALTRPAGSPQSDAAGSVSIDVAGFPKGALAGEPAPDMSVALFDGSRFVMSEYRSTDGRPLVLNLWASWCGPCRVEIPEFSRVAEENPQVAFLGVAVEDATGPAEAFAAEVGASYPLGIDDNLSVTDNYPFIGLPVTYLIGADGSITRQVNGQISGETLKAFIHHDFGTH